MGVNVGHLYRRRTLRSLDGNIREMLDEADGGYIIRGGQVVNQAKIDELAKKEQDKKMAAVAQQHQTEVPPEILQERAVAPSKMQELEKKIEDTDKKLDAILAILNKK